MSITTLGQEIRQACLDYLSAYGTLRDRLLVLRQEWLATDPDQRQPGHPLLETFAPTEANEFKRAGHILQITAGGATSEAARLTTLYIWNLAKAAREPDDAPFDELVAAALSVRLELYAAMRAELEGSL
ncbi:hypothetical protein [Nocardia sp. NPDC004711]